MNLNINDIAVIMSALETVRENIKTSRGLKKELKGEFLLQVEDTMRKISQISAKLIYNKE